MNPAPTATGNRRGGAGEAPAGRERRLTVLGWFHLILAMIMVLVIGCAVIGGQVLSHTVEQSDQIMDRVQPAQAQTYRLQKSLLDQETGLRGFVLSQDKRFLEPYERGRAEERTIVGKLRKVVAGNSVLNADLSRVERLAGEWRREHAEPLIERARKESSETGPDAELSRSKLAFDLLREQFTVQDRHLREARDSARADLEDTRATSNWLFAAMVVAFLGTALALLVLLHRAVARPLRSLREASQQVGDGDFDHRIASSGPADLRTVATAVEDMRGRIVAELSASRSRERLLTEQGAELDEQAAELRRSNAELEQFAYVASHDLQEPLRKIASFCQLLEKRYGDQLDERGKQYIDFAVDGAKRMQVLINDLLTFSRVGRLDDAPEPVELGRLLEKALTNLSTAIEESGARVEVPDGLPEVVGDPTTLTMLWQNLVGNAVKFRAPDRPPVVRITVDEDEDEEFWRFCVADNGIGIPPEFAEKVFVIFQRLHGRNSYSGTGIGLALCKKIVDHHGGRIAVETHEGEGTRISFTLPRRVVTTAPADPTATLRSQGAAT